MNKSLLNIALEVYTITSDIKYQYNTYANFLIV